MESSRSTEQISTRKVHRIGQFFGDVKGELGRINWTTREEILVYTKIVVVATFLLGMAIYVTDLFIQSTLMGLAGVMRWITG